MRARQWYTAALAAGMLAIAHGGTDAAPPGPPSTADAPMSMPAGDPRTLESTPGSTPSLVEAVAPATAPVPDLPGSPGPSPAAGRLDAPVRVYVFTDYQCPVCRRALEPLKLLARSRANDVVLVVKQAASPRHPFATDAAVAALAAFRQHAFWTYQDRLFVDQQALTRTDLLALARTSGLDVDAFSRDLDAEPLRAQVRYESALADAFDLDATPTLVVNGQIQRGWGSYRGVEALVDREAARARTIAAEGVPASRIAYEATRRSGPDGPRLAAALFEPQS